MHLPVFNYALVPLFFAVSGFVLTHCLQTLPPGRFLRGRLLRLYPGYWLAALAVIALRYALWPGEKHASRHTLVALALVPDGRDFYALQVEWSLVYEAFLCVMIALLACAGRRGVLVGALVWVGAGLVKAVAWPGFGTRPLPTWAGVWLSGNNFPFLLGVLAYHVRDRGRDWRWAVAAAAVALAL